MLFFSELIVEILHMQLVEHWTFTQEMKGSAAGWALLCSNLGQVIHT